ncbi:hypothetical protein EBR96_07980, partial [bacterium]|nr:hypothetical protein [bacterium]
LPILYAKGLTPPPRYAGPKMTIYEPHIRRHENPGYYKNVGKLTLPGLPTQVIALYGIDFLSIRHNHIMPLRLPTNTVVSQTQLTLTQLAREINAGLVTKNPVAKVISHYIELTTLTTKTRYFHPETRIAVITACQMIVRRATRSMAQFGLQPILRTGFTIYASSPAAPFQSDSIAIALTNAISEQSPLSDDTKNHRTPIVIQCDAQFPHFYLANPSETIAVRYVGSIGDNILCHGIIDGKISHSPLAQYFANALFQNLFKGAPLRAWITGTINDLRQGKYNDLLIFSKRIRKSPKRYRRNIPAHIKAAQLINRYTGKIQYVICTSGPIPIELNPINIDYDFYIKTEIAPILEALDESRQIDLGSLPSPNQLELF